MRSSCHYCRLSLLQDALTDMTVSMTKCHVPGCESRDTYVHTVRQTPLFYNAYYSLHSMRVGNVPNCSLDSTATHGCKTASTSGSHGEVSCNH